MEAAVLQGPYTDEEIQKRIEACPQLASLKSITSALEELMGAEQSYTFQIAEIIRRDPTLTSRILRLVNSVFFGLSKEVNNIEDAIFYLGLKQVRQLAMATPIIEELSGMNAGIGTELWSSLWKHSIGTAILTREILSVANVPCQGDSDYVSGLLHNVGKVVMAYIFPEEFRTLIEHSAASMEEFAAFERDLIGWDHAQIGAEFLGRHQLSSEIAEAALYHNDPLKAPTYAPVAAAIYVANQMLFSVGVFGSEQVPATKPDSWMETDAWKSLFNESHPGTMYGIASLKHSLSRLPAVLHGMV